MSTQEGWIRNMRTALSPRQAFVRWGILPPLLIALFIGFAIVEPRFASINNLTNILRQHTYLLIITLGATLYLITRNYDLSNGSVVSLTSIVVAMVMSSDVGGGSATTKIVVGTLAGLAVGLIVGLVNGIVVMYFQISSFIVTLGMASIALSVALLLSGAAPVIGLPPEFPRYFGTGRLVGIPVPVLIGAVMVMVIYFLLNRTVLGRHGYIIGGNALAARVSGIPVRRDVIFLFVTGSMLAALVGVLLTARIASGESNIGLQYPLLSIVAAVLGGVSIYGGEGRVSGAVFGSLFIVMLSNGMDLTRIPGHAQGIVLGSLLIVALIVDRVRARLRISYE